MNEVSRLHPSLAHHMVSTLGWASMRPLQVAAMGPITAGVDTLLLAPTAGGKTEAAVFPLLSRMAAEGWTGLSTLYVCPLKALLNNLLPRLETYAGWTGRRVALWHGDTSQSQRKAIMRDPPDLLLTTPESLESMLVSAKVDHRGFFAGLRAVIADEVHAFGADDRGWHLLAVLERLTQIVGQPVQRIGLSATVGNPANLLTWLQGSSAGERPARVVAPELGASGAAVAPPDLTIDYVGSPENAAKVIAALHRGTSGWSSAIPSASSSISAQRCAPAASRYFSPMRHSPWMSGGALNRHLPKAGTASSWRLRRWNSAWTSETLITSSRSMPRGPSRRFSSGLAGPAAPGLGAQLPVPGSGQGCLAGGGGPSPAVEPGIC